MQNMDMDAPNLDSLPPHVTQQVKDLVARGNKIEAIKIFRSATGLGLKESKDVIDAISAGNAQAANQLMMGMGASSPQTPAAMGDTLAQVRQLMRADEKIQAIRVLRAASGLGLKDAKDKKDVDARTVLAVMLGKIGDSLDSLTADKKKTEKAIADLSVANQEKAWIEEK